MLDDFFESGGWVPPVERRGLGEGEVALPDGTIVFSADNHISIGEDIWYDRFPASMKDKAPRVWFDDGMFHIGYDGQSYFRPWFRPAIRLFDAVPGANSAHMDQRMADLDAEGITSELVFPNGVWALTPHPDPEVRELCFRIYNEYLAELQAKAPGRFYGVGFINCWDPKGARRNLAELKGLGLKTYVIPLKAPGADGKPIDWTSPMADAVLDEMEDAGLPVSHHIGENPPRSHYNGTSIGFVSNSGIFRLRFAEYIFGGILDRHPKLQIGWFEGGISWVASAIQDAQLAQAGYECIHNWELHHDVDYYWKNHMCASFIYDAVGLDMIDRIGTDKALWSSDYPHSESSIGRSRTFLKSVTDRVDISAVADIAGGNVMRFLKLTAPSS